MKRFWDGTKSFVLAVVIAALSLVPAWFAHLAISATLAPTWGYVFIVGLIVGAALVVFDFLRKAVSGIAPTRTRRRS